MIGSERLNRILVAVINKMSPDDIGGLTEEEQQFWDEQEIATRNGTSSDVPAEWPDMSLVILHPVDEKVNKSQEWPDTQWPDPETLVSKADTERRYTLGPMYVPDSLDAHAEWTDANELQKAVWEYVRKGDRRIRLQHDREVVAGEFVEVMAWPYPVTVPMQKSDGSSVDTTFPQNTVFLGVVWEPWAWEMVKNRELRGYSIGGKAQRVYVDLPDPDPADVAKAANKCPIATHDIGVNLAHRQKAIDTAHYGPLDPAAPNAKFWQAKADMWDMSIVDARKPRCGSCAAFIRTPAMIDCIETGLAEGDTATDAWGTVNAGTLGYCEAFDFKCASKRTCDAWIAGGPVTEEKITKSDPGVEAVHVDTIMNPKKKKPKLPGIMSTDPKNLGTDNTGASSS
jgi:hypothetical protein